MDLAEKLADFVGGHLQGAAVDLPSLRFGDEAVRLKNYTSSTLIESGVSTSSPILGAGKCFIGAHSYMNDGGYIRCDTGGVFLGRYNSIGRRVTIGAGMHRATGLSTSPILRGVRVSGYSEDEMRELGGRISSSKTTVIGSDVWIGDGVVIMPGIEIGTGAIIAANAVVTRDVESYSVVGGVPARQIKRRFPSRVIDGLLASCWWERSVEDLNALPLANVHVLLKHEFPGPSTFATWRPVANAAV